MIGALRRLVTRFRLISKSCAFAPKSDAYIHCSYLLAEELDRFESFSRPDLPPHPATLDEATVNLDADFSQPEKEQP